MERHFALGHFDHARAIGMATGHRGPEIRQAGRNHRAQIARTINADLHHSSDGEIACCLIFYIYAVQRGLGRVREGHVRREKGQVMGREGTAVWGFQRR